jgi:predicted enzyme related to lactoylglutathione lyase
MSERDRYPAGVPCWVETLQPDVQAALDFYGPVFGWDFTGPGAIPGDPPGQYFVGRLRGRDVAGVGSLPDGARHASWATYIRVDNVDDTIKKAQDAGGKVLVEPVDAPPAGRLAVLADPSGAAVCAWEAGTREGAQLVNEPSAWAMSTLHTPDTKEAEKFYGLVFGWEPEQFGPVTLWRLPGYVGGTSRQPVPRDVVGVMAPIAAGANGAAAQPRWSVDFWIDDADAAAARAAALGGSVIMAPHDTPGFRSSVIADPQGAVFSISQLVRPH